MTSVPTLECADWNRVGFPPQLPPPDTEDTAQFLRLISEAIRLQRGHPAQPNAGSEQAVAGSKEKEVSTPTRLHATNQALKDL